ncbi:MAG: hypothetical protein HPPSJP_0280 [Candidatus Hepatoplasma scabrum]|nr:MAG: hypothetical protein HPPSJP_0280 [Candidatus Hepatoplasma sp.]
MNIEDNGDFNPIYLLPLIANFALVLIINLREISIFSNLKNYFLTVSLIFIYIFLLFIFAIFFFFILDTNDFFSNPPLDFFILLISEIFYYYFLYLLIFFAILGVDSIYNNFFKLETFSTQNEVSYFKITLAQDYLKRYIFENNYKYGFLVLFDIDNNFLLRNDINFILEHLKLKIQKNYQNAFFLKIDSRYYSVFLPFKRSEIDLELIYQNNQLNTHKNDYFSDLEKILSKIKINDKNIQAAVSIYGLDSYDLNHLIYDSSYLLNPLIKNNDTIVNVYDFRKITDRLIRNSQSQYLIKMIKNYDINYVRANTKLKIYYPIIYIHDYKYKKINFYDWLKIKKFSQSEQIILERYFANKVIENSKNYHFDKLVLNYPLKYLLNSNFDKNKFLNNIKAKIDFNKIIIGVFIDQKIKESYNLKKLKDNFAQLGIEFAILNLEKFDDNFYDILKPLWFKYEKEYGISNFFRKKDKDLEKKFKKYGIKDNLLN